MDLDLCRTVISKSFPEITIERIQSLDEALDDSSEGWDTCACVVNGEFVFLFPRYQHGADSLKLQAKLLPHLRNVISIPIPEFDFVSPGCQEFQEIFVGHRMIKGAPLTENLFRQVCTGEVAQRLGLQLAGFLSELHKFPVERAKELAVPSVPDKERWTDFYKEIVKRAFPLLDGSEQQWTTALFESFLSCEENFQFQPVLLDGDLSPEHILFDRGRKRISGIIDFGDARVGDPTYDFQLDYGDDFLLEVMSNYQGQIDDTFFRRLEFYNRPWPFHEILYGLYCDKSEHIHEGMESLRQVMATEKAKAGS
ncbi:MAG: phosphotransferase family protein [Candidatus Zixiibacteriota bacterium]